METLPTEPSKLGWLPQWPWLSNPWFTVIGTLVGVIALALWLYGQFGGQRARELIITSDPPVAIVRAGQASSVDILYHGEKIKTDVFARQVYMWNAGSDSIRHENILEPVRIVIPHATILETRVRKVSRSLTNITAEIKDGNTVILSRSILEHNDGSAIDIIYAAPNASTVAANGTIEHQTKIRAIEYQLERNQLIQGWPRIVLGWLLIGLAIFLLIQMLRLLRWLMEPKNRRPTSQFVLGCVFLVIGTSGAVIVLWAVFTSLWANVIPPVY